MRRTFTAGLLWTSVFLCGGAATHVAGEAPPAEAPRTSGLIVLVNRFMGETSAEYHRHGCFSLRGNVVALRLADLSPAVTPCHACFVSRGPPPSDNVPIDAMLQRPRASGVAASSPTARASELRVGDVRAKWLVRSYRRRPEVVMEQIVADVAQNDLGVTHISYRTTKRVAGRSGSSGHRTIDWEAGVQFEVTEDISDEESGDLSTVAQFRQQQAQRAARERRDQDQRLAAAQAQVREQQEAGTSDGPPLIAADYCAVIGYSPSSGRILAFKEIIYCDRTIKSAKNRLGSDAKVSWKQDGWVALAVGEGDAWGVGYGRTEKEAADHARQNCQGGGNVQVTAYSGHIHYKLLGTEWVYWRTDNGVVNRY